MYNVYGIWLVVILNIKFLNCQSLCTNFQTCGGCIGYANEICVWCSLKDHEGSRCQSKAYKDTNKLWCNGSIHYSHEKLTVQQNDPFSSKKDGNKVVQFKPQMMAIKARPGSIVNFTMSYQPAEDYPLDVYYLMDYSSTMNKHRAELIKECNEIYMQLTSLTNNVRLGVGSFVEKPGVPFAGPQHIAYSFKNHLSLTQDMTSFINSVKNGPSGANYDDPEAGLDALMQAMVCKHEVGWRSGARRIIVLCTDSTYHSAGDGKIVGAVKPNDMKCHLDSGNYTMALSLDYPSVSQINKIATDLNIKILFAANENVKREYEALSKNIRGAKYVALTSDKFEKSNIVEIIKNEYLELLRNLELNMDVPSDVKISLEPDCSIENECKVKHHEPVIITAFLKIKACLQNNNGRDFVRISPVGLNEKLTIQVDVDCECDCEKNGEVNSEMCSRGGTYQCGVCKCNDNRYGKKCQCVGTSDSMDLDKCKLNKNDTNFCSGRGTCRCGKCEECQKGFSGDFCEFDDNACLRPHGKLCAGHGKCRFGKCYCDPHWTGDDCRCPDHNRACTAPYSMQVCSGNGECVCGECICKRNENNDTYHGKYCDFCEKCSEKRCKELEEYVYCNYMYDKTVCDQTYNQTLDTDVLMVNETEMNIKDVLARECRKSLDDGSFIVFKYFYQPTNNRLHLMIQKEKELPPEINIWTPVAIVIGVVLLIGLLTVIIWKILMDKYDSREYKKFMEESAAAGFDVSLNPLYQEPAVSFTNPTFRRTK